MILKIIFKINVVLKTRTICVYSDGHWDWGGVQPGGPLLRIQAGQHPQSWDLKVLYERVGWVARLFYHVRGFIGRGCRGQKDITG